MSINVGEVQIGKPLPWNAFDPQGNLASASADVVRAKEHLDVLLSGNSLRDPEPIKSNDEVSNSGGDTQDGSYTFEAMKLKVGDRLQVQPPARFSSDAVVVRLIGYVNNLSLLVTSPREANGLRLLLVENDKLELRVFSSQNAFGFSATVSKIIKVPFEYLHLSFPCDVKGMVIRKAPRVKTKIICSIIAEQSSDVSLPGMLVNLSATGALLDSRRAIAGTVKLLFRVLLHEIEVILTVNAVVRAQFTDETPVGGASIFFHHGLEFVDLQPNDKLILQSMVYQQMIEKPQTVL